VSANCVIRPRLLIDHRRRDTASRRMQAPVVRKRFCSFANGCEKTLPPSGTQFPHPQGSSEEEPKYRLFQLGGHFYALVKVSKSMNLGSIPCRMCKVEMQVHRFEYKRQQKRSTSNKIPRDFLCIRNCGCVDTDKKTCKCPLCNDGNGFSILNSKEENGDIKYDERKLKNSLKKHLESHCSRAEAFRKQPPSSKEAKRSDFYSEDCVKRIIERLRLFRESSF